MQDGFCVNGSLAAGEQSGHEAVQRRAQRLRFPRTVQVRRHERLDDAQMAGQRFRRGRRGGQVELERYVTEWSALSVQQLLCYGIERRTLV